MGEGSSSSSSSNDTAIRELIEFLSSPRPDLRQAAMDIIVGLTADDSSLHRLIQANVIQALCRLLGDQNPIAEGAVKALINITAAQPSASEQTLEYDIINRIYNQLELPEWKLKDLSLMILANVTITEIGAEALLSDPKYAARSTRQLQLLTSKFLESEPEPLGVDDDHNPLWDDEYQYVANILANLTQVRAGRAFLTCQYGRGQGEEPKMLMNVLLPQMHSLNVIRRRGICHLFRNLAFDADDHKTLYETLDVVTEMLILLSGPEELSDDDKDGLSPRVIHAVQQSHQNNTREPDVVVRAAAVDFLLLLCATQDGREFLRQSKVYPIIREAHLVEHDDDIGNQIYQLVGFLMRDEDGQEPDWNEISRQTFAKDKNHHVANDHGTTTTTTTMPEQVVHDDDDHHDLKKKEKIAAVDEEENKNQPESSPKPKPKPKSIDEEMKEEEELDDVLVDALAQEIEALNPASDSEEEDNDDLTKLD